MCTGAGIMGGTVTAVGTGTMAGTAIAIGIAATGIDISRRLGDADVTRIDQIRAP